MKTEMTYRFLRSEFDIEDGLKDEKYYNPKKYFIKPEVLIEFIDNLREVYYEKTITNILYRTLPLVDSELTKEQTKKLLEFPTDVEELTADWSWQRYIKLFAFIEGQYKFIKDDGKMIYYAIEVVGFEHSYLEIDHKWGPGGMYWEQGSHLKGWGEIPQFFSGNPDYLKKYRNYKFKFTDSEEFVNNFESIKKLNLLPKIDTGDTDEAILLYLEIKLGGIL